MIRPVSVDPVNEIVETLGRFDQRRARLLAETRHQVDHTGGNARLD